MQWFDKKNPCACEADQTQVSTMHPYIRGTWNGKWGDDHKVVYRKGRGQKVRHYRQRDEAHFWHWKDQKDNLHT